MQDIMRISKQIDLTSERALRLVTDLTKVARLEDAMFELEPINVRKVCDDIVGEMCDVFYIHNKEIIFKPYKNPKITSSLVVANYDLLRSILLNFSDNALYSSKDKSKIEISINNIKDKVRVSVRDYGSEIPISVWRSIKKDNCKPVSSSSRPQSSGLGIYIAHNFASAMNGEIGVIRHKNGNTFFIDLTRSDQLSLL